MCDSSRPEPWARRSRRAPSSSDIRTKSHHLPTLKEWESSSSGLQESGMRLCSLNSTRNFFPFLITSKKEMHLSVALEMNQLKAATFDLSQSFDFFWIGFNSTRVDETQEFFRRNIERAFQGIELHHVLSEDIKHLCQIIHVTSRAYCLRKLLLIVRFGF